MMEDPHIGQAESDAIFKTVYTNMSASAVMHDVMQDR